MNIVHRFVLVHLGNFLHIDDPSIVSNNSLSISDCSFAVLLGLAGFFSAFVGSSWLVPFMFDMDMFNLYFNGDLPLIALNMIDNDSEHYRNNVHPLFSLFASLPTILINKLFFDNPTSGLRVIISVVAGLGLSCLFILLRLMRLQRIDSAIFSLLASVSAGSIFWFTVPETFTFGAVSIILCLILVTMNERKSVGPSWQIANLISTVSFTVTNGISGVATLLVSNPFKSALRISFIAFAIFLGLWIVQKFLFPSSGFLLNPIDELGFLQLPELGRINSLIFNTMAVSDVERFINQNRVPELRIQHMNSAPWMSADFIRMLASWMWGGLLLFGFLSMICYRRHIKLQIVLVATFIFQIFLHMIYGDDPFLYSAHFVPILITFSAFAALTRFRRLVLSLTIVLIVFVAINNISQLNKSTKFFVQNFPTSKLDSL